LARDVQKEVQNFSISLEQNPLEILSPAGGALVRPSESLEAQACKEEQLIFRLVSRVWALAILPLISAGNCWASIRHPVPHGVIQHFSLAFILPSDPAEIIESSRFLLLGAGLAGLATLIRHKFHT
jgi:hypothetical protein